VTDLLKPWRLDKATVQRRVKFSEESESAIGSLVKRAVVASVKS
jgi:hypothetical protein